MWDTNPDPRHWMDGLPIAVMGFFSGMFTTVYLSSQYGTAVDPALSGMFALGSGAVAVWFTYLFHGGGGQ